ncbi:MAG: hydrogenase formation protein HypD [Bacteroidales bacterium]|nr:hydrogenase formation protein HypD [Bacteroidales bacterium]
MKYIDEYRDGEIVRKLVAKIAGSVTRQWRIMEICGGQTHAIMKYNLTELLPPEIILIHGPGCPVCVTPLEKIDKALALACEEGTILTSFGDMMRVPGSSSDLLKAKAEGADVRLVYSPLDAVKTAISNPDSKVVFFAIGFETTAPANALALLRANTLRLNNFFLLSSHVLVPPAINAILSSEDSSIDGLLAPGHVCTVTGYNDYIKLADDFRVPVAVTGFEPVDILNGILTTVKMLESGRNEVENSYARSVQKEGNRHALKTMYEVFEVCDRQWRGIGLIPGSGLDIREKYSAFDAEKHFTLNNIISEEPGICIAGDVLRGTARPSGCPAFGTACTPDHPLGAPMVSSEGACAAYYQYKSQN